MSTVGWGMSSASLKLSDTAELSRLFEAEFNKPDLHDRVLIFDVVASPPQRLVEENENEMNEASGRDHDDDGNAVGTAKNANDEKGMIQTVLETKPKLDLAKSLRNMQIVAVFIFRGKYIMKDEQFISHTAIKFKHIYVGLYLHIFIK
jgi:hypothetical protein